MENNDLPSDPAPGTSVTPPIPTPSYPPVLPSPLQGPNPNYQQQNAPIVPPSFVTYPERTKSKTVLWVSSAVMLLLVGASIAYYFLIHTSNTTKQNTTAKTAVPPRIPAPLVTNNAPATISVGTFTVGTNKNIVPGLYGISPGSGQSGDLTITSATVNYTATLNSLAVSEKRGTPTAWAQLASGDVVHISGPGLKTVTFSPVATSSSNPASLAKLYTSSFTVTDDPARVNPGKSFTFDKEDKNAYILVINPDYTIKYNNPLDSTGFIMELADGDQVGTVGVVSGWRSDLR